uniref:Major facilitator superfamily (MFS) profile domain-containing protein n=1 Tax=Schizophyllum commune (strain H4-8 / FGSC 9210) TaxID=578458 RepID=D8PVH9_SCHCM
MTASEETTPLLASDVEQSPERAAKKETPLPLRQLAIVYLIQFCEPLTGLVIYPFIAELVQETGITGGNDKATAFYAGIVESMFFFSEFMTCLQWGRLSDYYGRRPVLLFGPLGLALSMYGFGLSKTFWQLCIFRFLQGTFNGNIGVSKSVMAELTDSSNRARAFAMMPLMWSVADTLAPLIGALNNPASEYPNVFGGIKLFEEFPYFLPCAIAGTLSLFVFIFALFDLKETHPAKIRCSLEEQASREREASADGYGTFTDEPSTSSSPERAKVPPLSTLLRTPAVRRVLIVYAFLCFFEMALASLLPIILYTRIPDGGLGLSSHQIGVVLAAWGAYNVFFQFFASPRLTDRLGAFKMQVITQGAIPLIFVLFPLENALARAAGGFGGSVQALLVVHLMVMSLIYVSYGTIHMFIVESSPTNDALGAVNGLAQTTATLIRTFAPWAATSLFSLSLERQLAGGNLVYIILGFVALGGAASAFVLLPRRLHHD